MCDAEDEAHVSRAARWRRFADDANLGGPPPGLYDRLVRSAPTSGTIAKQIDKDLHRTFGSLQGLRVPTPEAMQSLRNVLLAYSLHNPQVGYCQSMNFLAAVLLLIVDEEYSFWCLAAVVERLMPGHFSCCMEMALVDQGVLSHFLRVEDPILVNHLEDLMVAPSLVTTQWLLTCFVGSSLPLRALLRLWDRFFEERHVACLFRIAAALVCEPRTSPQPRPEVQVQPSVVASPHANLVGAAPAAEHPQRHPTASLAPCLRALARSSVHFAPLPFFAPCIRTESSPALHSRPSRTAHLPPRAATCRGGHRCGLPSAFSARP